MINNLSIIAQITIALSIVVVWVFRFDNIEGEFKYFGLSNLVRNLVGATKISLATLLVTGIWFPSLVLIPSLMMALLMIGAQIAHWKVKNRWSKHAPSLALLVLSLFIAGVHSGIIN